MIKNSCLAYYGDCFTFFACKYIRNYAKNCPKNRLREILFGPYGDFVHLKKSIPLTSFC